MAELLRIKPLAPNLDPGQVRVPVPGQAFIGKGLSDFGETSSLGAQYEMQQQTAEAKAEAIRMAADMQAEAGMMIQEHADTLADPDEFKEKSTARLKDIHQAKLDLMKPQSRQMFTDATSNDLTKFQGMIDKGARGKRHEKIKGDYQLAKAQLIKSAGADMSEENRRQVGQMFGQLLGTLTQTGEIGAENAAVEGINFTQAVEKEANRVELDKISQLVADNPEAVEKALIDTQTLSGAQKYTMKQHAKVAINEKRIQEERIEKEKLEQVNQGIVSRVYAGRANLSGIREEIRRDETIPPRLREHWIDKIDNMLEHKMNLAKASAAQARANDPYLRSNPETFGKVMQGVIREPDKWDQTTLDKLHGKGLSTQHWVLANTTRNATLAAAVKAGRGPRQADPLVNALQMIDKLEKDLAFIVEPERRKDYTPETSEENGRIAQDVMTEVVERANKGENAQQVLNEVMQPFYEQTVTSYMSWIGAFFSPDTSFTREERIAARQLLARANKKIDEETITKTAKAMRDEKKPRPKAPKMYGGPGTER